MLTRITDRKIPCAFVYIHVYRMTKNWEPGPYNSLRHADNKRYFSGLFNAKLKGRAHVLLGEGSGKIWTCSCWEKRNFAMINKFKYGQTRKIWPSPHSLSLYNPFKACWHYVRDINGCLSNSRRLLTFIIQHTFHCARSPAASGLLV